MNVLNKREKRANLKKEAKNNAKIILRTRHFIRIRKLYETTFEAK